MDYLKRETVEIKNLGKSIELRELNGKAQAEVMQAHGDGDVVKVSAVIVKYGVTEFDEKTVDEVMEMLPLRTLTEISDAVTKLSDIGIDQKN